MLIIEGSDCLGKTTFANLLVSEAAKREKYPIYYSHMSRPNSAFDFFDHYTDMMSKFAVQDRFHIGGIVWHSKINEAELSIIEGRLRSIGSMTMMFYVSDFVWFKKKLKEDNRGNMFGDNAIIAANEFYKKLAEGKLSKKPIIDFAFDIKKKNQKVPGYPEIEYASYVLDQWFERLSLLET